MAGIGRAPLPQQREISAELERSRGRRLVISTDRDPRQARESGLVLPELLAAVGDHVVHLPPLRERGGDVELLACRFLHEIDGALAFDTEAMDSLLAHAWPGNVRFHTASSAASSPTSGDRRHDRDPVLGRHPAARRQRQKAPVADRGQ